jgi:hypothetical protein
MSSLGVPGLMFSSPPVSQSPAPSACPRTSSLPALISYQLLFFGHVQGSPCPRPAMATRLVRRTPGVGGHTGCRGGGRHICPCSGTLSSAVPVLSVLSLPRFCIEQMASCVLIPSLQCPSLPLSRQAVGLSWCSDPLLI